MPTLIYLIGFMGSGKSTLGSILANVLGYDFVDSDEAVEKRVGTAIQEYFKDHGEASFRSQEHQIIAETAEMTDTVVSTGGGAFLEPDNRSLMTEHGSTIYLRVPVSQLSARLKRSRNRPLLFDDEGKTLRGPALHARIERLLAERAPIYEQAQLVIDVDAGPVGGTVDKIVNGLKFLQKA